MLILRTHEICFITLHISSCVQLFLTEGKGVIVDPDHLEQEKEIGHGAYATVYRAQIKRQDEVSVCVCVCVCVCVMQGEREKELRFRDGRVKDIY